MGSIVSLVNFSKFKMKRNCLKDLKTNEGLIGCSACGGYTFAVIEGSSEYSRLRCACCYTDIQTLRVVESKELLEISEPEPEPEPILA